MIKLTNWEASLECNQDEIKTMIAGVVTELKKGETNWSVYIGGDTLIWGVINDDGKMEIFDCKIRRTNLEQDDIVTLNAPVPVNKGFPS